MDRKQSSLALSCLLLGCVLAATPLYADPIERNVLPADANSAVEDWLEPHFVVVDPMVAPRGRLFVFMPGSFGTPASYLEVVRYAASLGYHAVGLRYPNSWAVNFTLCQGSLDLDCHEKVRLEILDGVDRSPLIEVGPVDSIQQRVAGLLEYLQVLSPNENWGQFLSDVPEEGLVWENLVVAGHSQGGGHAAMIAKVHVVDGALLFAGGPDFNSNFGQLAPWLVGHATPSEDYVGFVHSEDGSAIHIATWNLLGLTGAPVDVASAPFPYMLSQQLVTTLEPANPGEYHGSVVVDQHLPVEGGEFAYLPVWEYMFRRVASNSTPAFLRGDANGDGLFDLSDPVTTLASIFGGAGVSCPAAADANADDTLNIADPIRSLGALFSGAPPPPAPFPDCDQLLLAPVLSCTVGRP